jgi:hypothetical protein
VSRPGPVSTRLAILRVWIHAVPVYLPGVPVPSTAQLTRGARRQAREDRASGYRVLPPERPASGLPWGGQ